MHRTGLCVHPTASAGIVLPASTVQPHLNQLLGIPGAAILGFPVRFLRLPSRYCAQTTWSMYSDSKSPRVARSAPTYRAPGIFTQPPALTRDGQALGSVCVYGTRLEPRQGGPGRLRAPLRQLYTYRSTCTHARMKARAGNYTDS